ncbi:MAG: hypothetical protein GXP42_01210, partial [Chloroflexi bacterium]|nr:hypothetical protein [Chloroflexota bacterium]
MKPFVIGVDGGGSKTDAVILSQEGELLGRGRGGPSNLHLVGAPATRAALWAAMKQAAQEAEVELSQAAAVVWALAGAGRSMEAELLRELQAELLPEARGRVVTDILAALVGGVGARYGVAVVAGTGAAVYGEDAAGQSARAGGWGHLVDRGSGHHIGLEALRAVARAADRAELPTLLTQRILATLNLTTESELIHWLYATERQVSDIAALAPLVIEVAQEGDLVATEIIARAADALAEDVDAVAKRLRFDEKKFPLVLTGGLLLGHPFFRSVVIQSIRTRAPAAQPRLPRFDAAIGAGLLAVELSGRALARPSEADAPIEEDVWASEQSNVLTRELDMRPTL